MDFSKIIEQNKEQMLKTLKELLQIRSVLDESLATKEQPFGPGIDEALKYMLDVAKQDGFKTVNDEGYAGHISYGDNENDLVGVLCHLDVVPEGSNWTYPPYSATIVDNKIYARGAIDDKGPTVAAYYALKFIKDAGIKLKKEIRLILGTDEETGWRGVAHYFKNYPMPSVGFAPDSSFPLIYGEKGRMSFDLSLKDHNCCQVQNDIIVSIKGGERYNVVLDSVEAVANVDLSVEYMKYLENNNLTGDVIKVDNLYHYTLNGVAAHAMEPHKGRNAGTYICDFFKDYSKNSLVEYIAKMHHLDHYMKRHELDYDDYEMGPITCNIGIIDISKNASRVTLDLRYPVRYDIEKYYKVFNEIIDKFDLVITNQTNKKPHYVSPSDPLVVLLSEAYVKHSHDTVNKPFTVGGGTYASMMPKAVAFGPELPGEVVLAHQRDEYFSLDTFFMSVLIYIDTIIALGEIDA